MCQVLLVVGRYAHIRHLARRLAYRPRMRIAMNLGTEALGAPAEPASLA